MILPIVPRNVKAAKVIAIVFIVYVGLVITFESSLGYFQPEQQTSLVITTTADGGTPHDRVVQRLQIDHQLYVSANHWPRAWYNRALRNPNVRIELDGEKSDYVAVRVAGEEHDRVDGENRLGLVFRFLTGFPPRRIVRLDPRF